MQADNRGFTLIEVMVAIVISAIATIGAYDIFISQQRTYSAQEQVAAMQQNVRVAMDLMMREIRMAGYDQLTTGFDEIITAIQTSVQIRADLNEDGDTADQHEDITFTLVNNMIARTDAVDGVAQPLSENIVNLAFVYFDANGNQIPYADIDGVFPVEQNNRNDIRQVSLTVIARTEREDSNWQGFDINGAPGGGYRIRSLTVNIRPRNLGL